MSTIAEIALPTIGNSSSFKAACKPHRYIRDRKFEKHELLDKLPPIDSHYRNEARQETDLGVTGIGQQTSKTSSMTQFQVPKKIQSNRSKRKRSRKSNTSKKQEICLPKIEVKTDKTDIEAKTRRTEQLNSLVRLFRPSEVSPIANSKKKRRRKDLADGTDVILSKIIDRIKIEQDTANKELQNTVLHGKGIHKDQK